jgi:phosphatidylinositol kinase/protein kinase (PI-3  family)
LPIFLRPYEIFVTSSSSGFLEFIPDTNSIDYLKKKFPSTTWNLHTFFSKYFKDDYSKAQRNFVESLAGYAIFTYLFSIKDRHNGNILIDNQGHLIHIDFGFFLQNSPGNMNFEHAPFKFT